MLNEEIWVFWLFLGVRSVLTWQLPLPDLRIPVSCRLTSKQEGVSKGCQGHRAASKHHVVINYKH